MGNPVVDVLEEEGLYQSILLSLHILEIVGVDNANNLPELDLPPAAMVVPCQMLGLLENCHIGIFIWDNLCDIPHR